MNKNDKKYEKGCGCLIKIFIFLILINILLFKFISHSEKEYGLKISTIENIIKYSIVDKNKILNLNFENKKIYLKLRLDTTDIPESIENKNEAISMYSIISNELLKTKGWENLEIEFENIGVISMNEKSSTKEKIKDLELKYFEYLKIEKHFKKMEVLK